MSTGWRKASFKITVEGLNDDIANSWVTGEVCGYFGIHKKSYGSWELTHLPTGYACPIPGHYSTAPKEVLIKITKIFNSFGKLWNQEDPQKVMKNRVLKKKIREVGYSL